MEAIPSEFTKIIERLELLKKVPVIGKLNEFDYVEAVWRFKVVAKSTIWCDASQIVVERITKLIGEFYKENYQRYNDIQKHTELQRSELVLFSWETKKGETFEATPKILIEKRVETKDEHRKKWYSNIVPELLAYESLKLENLNNRPLIGLNDAEKLSQYIINGCGPLIKDSDESRNNFIRLLSDPCLLDYEIENMKIYFGVQLKAAAFEIKSFIQNNSLPYTTTASLIKLGCFYHINKGKEVLINPRNFSSTVSKTAAKKKK